MSWGSNGPKTDVVIDIETIANPITQADIDRAMQEYSPPSNYKSAAAIAKHKDKFKTSIVEKLVKENQFSIGGKKMISCALGIVDHDESEVTDIQSWISDDLSVVTRGVAAYLDRFSDYRLVGWNHIGFDLPELAKSFAITGVRPRRKPSKWDLIDLCNHPFKRTSLKDTARAFGLELLDVKGDNVAQMWADGEYERIQQYNEHDVKITGQLYIAANSIFSFF